MNLKEFKKELTNEGKLGKIGKRDIAFEIAQKIVEARIIRGVTQGELAKKIKTKQPSIARIENGNSLPSIIFLEKIAKALDFELTLPSFVYKERVEQVNTKSDGASLTLEDYLHTEYSGVEVIIGENKS